jgi:hypothetical protein
MPQPRQCNAAQIKPFLIAWALTSRTDRYASTRGFTMKNYRAGILGLTGFFAPASYNAVVASMPFYGRVDLTSP